MARIVVSELLCFIRHNFDKLTVSQLKPVVCNFYKDNDVCEAKDILLKDIHALVSSDTLPRMPNRQGPSKCKQSVDDVFKLFTIADEQRLWDSLPRYVAGDLCKVPFLNADSVSTINLSKRLEAMEQRLLLLEQTMTSNVLDVDVSDNSGGISQDVCSDVVTNTAADSETDSTWADVTRKKPHKSGRPVKNDHSLGNSQSSTSGTQPVANGTQSQRYKKNQKVLGNRNDKDSTLKAGVRIIKKAVVHIDNLSPECTEALLKDYLLTADIPVVSCYTATSWLRENERDQVSAFRVCVPAESRHLLFDPQLWSQGVIIRDWKFKQSQHG